MTKEERDSILGHLRVIEHTLGGGICLVGNECIMAEKGTRQVKPDILRAGKDKISEGIELLRNFRRKLEDKKID